MSFCVPLFCVCTPVTKQLFQFVLVGVFGLLAFFKEKKKKCSAFPLLLYYLSSHLPVTTDGYLSTLPIFFADCFYFYSAQSEE